MSRQRDVQKPSETDTWRKRDAVQDRGRKTESKPDNKKTKKGREFKDRR